MVKPGHGLCVSPAVLVLGPDRYLLTLCLLMLLSACGIAPPKHAFEMPGIKPGDARGMVWPASPEVPRYAFIGHLYGESNTAKVDPERGAFSNFMAALVGLDGKQSDAIDLVQPQQVCSDGQGRVYAADSGRQAVFVFDEELGEFFIWNESSLNIPFLSPVGVAYVVDSVWVTDSELSLVYRLTRQGDLIDTLGKGVVVRPTGISYDPDGKRVFISDTGDNNIKVFDLDGTLMEVWGSTGPGDGELNRPTFIAYRDDRLYVSDSLNARVQVFDALGDYRGTFGQRGLYIGNLARPKGIALDSDRNVYVSESYYDYVVIYNESGELLMSLGGSGLEPGQFSQPTGVWVDDKDRVFVSDMLNRRISMFQYLGGN
jgi:DNA-binding beta-propeller fold protein YncE